MAREEYNRYEKMMADENDTYVMPCIRYRVQGIRFGWLQVEKQIGKP